MQVKAKTVSKDAKIETPSEKIVREARPTRTVTDSRGRVITYQRLGVMEEAQLARQLGAELAGNAEYMRYVRIAKAVKTIDGEYGTAPTKMSMIEVRMDWIGDEGYIAVYNDMVDQLQTESENNEEPVDEGEELKNS